MATTRKTTIKEATAKKTTAKRSAKPKLEIVKDEAEQELSVFEQMAARNPVRTTEVDLGDGITVQVFNRLPYRQELELIARIVSTCVNEERGEVNFHMLDYVAKLFITSVYCGLEIPSDLDTGYASNLGEHGIYHQIISCINAEQLNEIWDGCRMQLRAKQEMYNSAAAKITIDMIQKFNELYEMLSSVTENFDSAEAMDALKKLTTITGAEQ